MNTVTLLFWNAIRLCWRICKKPLQLFTLFLRTTWLLFPATFFCFIIWTSFWNLSQGKDVLIAALEKEWVGGITLLAILFWVLATWYSSRILIYRKKQLYEENETIAFHTPRVLGFLGFSIIWIALLRLPALPDQHFTFRLNPGMDMFWLLFSLVAYAGLYILFKRFRDNKVRTTVDPLTLTDAQAEARKRREKRKFKIIYWFSGSLVFVILVLNTFISSAWLLWCSIVVLQVAFIFIIITRRQWLPLKSENDERFEMPQDYATIQDWQQAEAAKGNVFNIGVWERILYNANIPRQEKWFFITYQCVALASIGIYAVTIGCLPFSLLLGSFATILLAVGILIGFFSIVSFVSVSLRVNFHVIGFIAVIIFGKAMEPHYVNLIAMPKGERNAFERRPELNSYFKNWTEQRRADIENGTYPVFFVLADGGASRSGYWTAATLSKLEDTTAGKFSEHLFCLSGASGGSVGNGTFFSLLMQKERLKDSHINFTRGAEEFLQTDFLTFTLARMLGPDFMRPIIGSTLPMGDRAAALEKAIEESTGSDVFLHGVFKTPISALIPVSKTADLPVLCINITRMQDGRPCVISTIKADERIFNRRVDILKRLPADKDMRLSTAVVMGARFPYISPAGRIDSSYYVDGGYFDNSGAGFVHEMIIELRRIIADSLQANPSHYYRNLHFYVLHSQNGGNGEKLLQKIHPVWNDLAAPILTMMGAYGTQTSVNDLRLKTYMQELYRNTNETGYFSINLYSNRKSEEEYPMNWAISRYYINKMNEKLRLPNSDFAYFYNYMKARGAF